jgi:hypothetical protein
VRGLSKSDLPYYVIKKDTQKNIVYVSSNPAEQQALTKSLSLSGLHLPTIQPEELQNYTNLSLRTRHLGQLEPIQALKLNKNGTGLYLVNYPLEITAKIVSAIRQGQLVETEIINLLSDFIILSRSVKLNVGSSAVLDILEMAKASSNPHFWSLAGGFFGDG